MKFKEAVRQMKYDLREMKYDARKGDVVRLLVYLVGDGGIIDINQSNKDWHFLLPECTQHVANGLSLKEFCSLLEPMFDHYRLHVLFILDCCFKAYVGPRSDCKFHAISVPNERRLRLNMNNSCIQVLARPVDARSERRGNLTTAIIETLTGRNSVWNNSNWMDFESLFANVVQQIPDCARPRAGWLLPKGCGDVNGTFCFFRSDVKSVIFSHDDFMPRYETRRKPEPRTNLKPNGKPKIEKTNFVQSPIFEKPIHKIEHPRYETRGGAHIYAKSFGLWILIVVFVVLTWAFIGMH